jgi:DNA-binding NtrC family response regulator
MKPSTTGGTPIRVLILEDNPSDAELMADALRQEGYEPYYERVENEPGFMASLPMKFDLILSDYSLPQFDGITAVKLARARGFHVPFVLVSGKIGEDIAVEAMRNGTDDYLLKDRIARLSQAARQAIEKRKLQEAQLAAERALARLNRVRAVLSGINSAILGSRTPSTMGFA